MTSATRSPAPSRPTGHTPSTAAIADRSYEPGRHPATSVLTTPARHLVSRFSYGVTPELARDVRAAGGHLSWFDRQLATAYDGSADEICDWWPDLHLDGDALRYRNAEGIRPGWEVMRDYGNRVAMRRMVSPRQVLEVMTEFWENHFHVPTNLEGVFSFRVEYGELIRRHALGRFEDLLQVTSVHPAMRTYLGAARSPRGPGRELLELHTVGAGNYTEDDLAGSARIIVGDHSDPDERAAMATHLSALARRPATARRVADKLSRAFVSDASEDALVDRLADVYLHHDTAIVPVLRALVRSPEFKGAVDQKIRDADEDVIATYRVLGVGAREARATADQVYWQTAMLGLAPLCWPGPDGQPVDNAAWSSPARSLAGTALHWDMANAWWPGEGLTFPRRRPWLPRSRSMAFNDLVDHLSRLLLHRPSTSQLLEACCDAVDVDPGARVDRRSDWLRGRWPRLVATVLDSPAFVVH